MPVPITDKIINWISPKWAFERARWRQASASYKEGVPTRTSESFEGSPGYKYGSQNDRNQTKGTRDRAFTAYKNNPVARTLVQTETDHVIGDGLNYQPTTDSPDWNREAEDKYYEWLENCSLRGPDAETGCEAQRTIWSYSRVGGDIGWVLVARGPESRIQIVRADNIVTPDDIVSDPNVVDGIRFDEFGRPVTFYVLSNDPITGQRKFGGVAARDFVWLPHMGNEPGLARPPSCYHTIFELLDQLSRYIDGVSLAAWMATVFGLIIKDSSSAKQVQGLPYLTDSQGEQRRAMTLENGMIKIVGTDNEVVQVQASQPMQQTAEFIRTLMRQLGAPFDMPLEVIAKDMSTCNFASARIGLLPFYRTCRIKAARFGSRWSRTIRFWLSREALRDDSDPKKWKTPFPLNFWNHELLPNAFDYTDPVSEVQSDMMQVEAGFKSPQMVISERGRDAAKIRLDRQDWQDQNEVVGLTESKSTLTRDAVVPTPAKPAAPPDPNQQDQTNGNGNQQNRKLVRNHPRDAGGRFRRSEDL